MSNYWIGLFLLLQNIAVAQFNFHYSITEEDGLPSSEVYQIIQDQKGYMWIGCDGGLFRYDGARFKPYRTEKQNSNSLSSLFIDNSGNLWCKNFSGQILCLKTDTLHLISDFSSDKEIYITCYDGENGFWKMTSFRLQHYDSLGKIILDIPMEQNENNPVYGSEMIKWRDRLWVDIPRTGLWDINPSEKKIQKVKGDSSATLSYKEHRLFVWKEKLYLLRSEVLPSIENRIYEINPDNGEMKQVYRFINPTQVRNYMFYEDNEHRLWTATSVGSFCLYDIVVFTYPFHTCFFGTKITSVIRDREGNFWFTGLNSGIHVIPDLRITRPHLEDNYKSDKELRLVKKLSSGKILFGAYYGTVGIAYPEKNMIESLDEINNISGITVKDAEEYKGKIYISRGRLFIYDTLTKKAGFPLNYSNARSLTILNDTMFMVSPTHFTKVSINDLKEGEEFPGSHILELGGRDLIHDDKGVYCALNNGLIYYFNGSTNYLVDENKQEIFTGHLCKANGYVWCASGDDGIIQLKDGRFVSRKYRDVFNASNTIRSMYGENQEIWISTGSYLYRYDLSKDTLFRLSRNLGLKASETYDITKNKETVILGTKDGLVYFPDSLIEEKRKAPELFLDLIHTDTDTFGTEDEIHLPYNFNNLTIEFTGIHYSSRKDLKFKYRVKELDENWTVTSYNNPRAIFTSLPAGNFNIEIIAMDESGQESKQLTIPLSVESPLWQKGWFYLLSSIFAIAIITLIYSLRIRSLRRKNELEKKLISSQLTALKAQMNPHFMYNALNSIQDLMLSNDHLASNRYLGRFSQLMRKILDASGKEFITIKEECSILNLYLELEKLRFGEEFNYEINVDSTIDDEETMIPPLILQPYVENAMKHGLLHKKGEKELKIRFSKSDHLICIIEDNGIGRKRSDEIKQRHHHSFASDATEKRLELLKNYTRQDFSIEITDLYDNGAAAGTLVTIHFPH